MALTPEEKQFEEVWESVAPMQNWYYRLDSRGDLQPKVVQGTKKFTIRTEERLATQEMIVEAKHDPFTNGCFRPVVVPSDINVDTSPNALSDDDIARLFRASDVAWTEYLKVVDSPATLRRFMELAESAEISLKRFREIEEKLAQVAPKTRITQKDQAQYEAMAGTAAPSPGKRDVKRA